MTFPTKEQMEAFVSSINEDPRKINQLPLYTIHYRLAIQQTRNSIITFWKQLLELCKEKEVEFSSRPTPKLGATIAILQEYIPKFQDAAAFLNKALNELAEGTTLQQRISEISLEEGYFQDQIDYLQAFFEEPEPTKDDYDELNS